MGDRKWIPLLLLVGVCYLLARLQHIFVPFVLAAALAYALNPWVAYLEMLGIRRQRAVMLVYLTVIVLLVGLAYAGVSAAIQSASNLGNEMPVYLHLFQKFIRETILKLDRIPWLPHFGIGTWLHGQLGKEGHAWAATLLQRIPGIFQVNILPFAEMALLVPFLVFFFMLDGPEFLDQLLDFVPARYVEMTLNIIVEINYSLGNYLRGILVQASFMGFLAGIGYALIGLHYAVYIALIVAATSMIPYLGPLTAALVGCGVALFQWGTPIGFVKVLAIYSGIRLLDDWVLQPLILRRAVHIHPILMVFTLLAGAYLGGVWGLLFGVPIACMLKVLLEVGWQWYQTEYTFRPLDPTSEAAEIPLI